MISKSYRIMWIVNGAAKEYSQELTREVARLIKRLVTNAKDYDCFHRFSFSSC